jgi:hypothetical protein
VYRPATRSVNGYLAGDVVQPHVTVPAVRARDARDRGVRRQPVQFATRAPRPLLRRASRTRRRCSSSSRTPCARNSVGLASRRCDEKRAFTLRTTRVGRGPANTRGSNLQPGRRFIRFRPTGAPPPPTTHGRLLASSTSASDDNPWRMTCSVGLISCAPTREGRLSSPEASAGPAPTWRRLSATAA